MQNKIRNSWMVTTVLIILCTGLSSFLASPGGDKYEIYLNNKLVLEQYVSMRTPVKYLTLHQANYNDRIDVMYSHCGTIGKNRIIVLKDGNKILKKWVFEEGSGATMSWKVSDIMDLQKGREKAALKLYYSSRELPDGRLLATVVQGNVSYVKQG